jgi:hypothetical protein
MPSLVLAALAALAAAGLPPLPQQVIMPAKPGDVLFRHDLHVERREACKSCHGDGIFGKIELDKESGHALCTGCHKQKDGPTMCSTCHSIRGQAEAEDAERR